MAAMSFNLGGCAGPQPPEGRSSNVAESIPLRCTPGWNHLVHERLAISDAAGHGPDVGSMEWMRAVSRKSGVLDAGGHGPDFGSDEWCRAVDYKVFGRR